MGTAANALDDLIKDNNTTRQGGDQDARRVIFQHIEQCTLASAAVERRLQSIDQRLEAAVNQRDASQREIRKYLIGIVSMALATGGWILSHGPIYVSGDRFSEFANKVDDRAERRDAEINSLRDRLREAEMKIQQLSHPRDQGG